MFTVRYQAGDLVYAGEDLTSDGQVPDTEDGQILVPKGTRGMVIQVGHAEAEPNTPIYLVRFEGSDRELGPPLGCLGAELSQDEAALGQPSAP